MMRMLPAAHVAAGPCVGAPGHARGQWPAVSLSQPETAMQWQPLQLGFATCPGLHQPQPTVSPRRPGLPTSALSQQQRPAHLDAAPVLLQMAPRPFSPEESSRRRRRSRTPLQPAPPPALRHASPHGLRSTSPARTAGQMPLASGRCQSPAAASSASVVRHTSPHGFQHAPMVQPQPVATMQHSRLSHKAEAVSVQPFSVQPSSHSELRREAGGDASFTMATIGPESLGLASEQAELAEGVPVRIGDCICHITAALGMGSFGVVWAAECEGIGEVAVKEIPCQSQTDLSRAIYEAQLLWILSTAASNMSATSSLEGLRIPAYVASDMSAAGPEGQACRVRLAMARLPGEPLDRFLREFREHLDSELSETSDNVQAAAEELRQATQACRFAQMLVLQLSPTMDRIAALAYHRDVNAHNILISLPERSDGRLDPQYGLVDFGLAVDAMKWRGGAQADARGRGDWQHLDVGGDCRYWPASAWLQFEVGCYELADYTSLCLEYQTHLDLQGLGITALQVLAELLPPPSSFQTDAKRSDSESEIGDGHAMAELWRLRAAWDQYWEAATSFWTALLETFRNQGDWNALKTKFIAIGVHEVISRKLHAVRDALKNAAEACKRSPGSGGLHGAQALFSGLLVLISAGEERDHTTSWTDVLAGLGGVKIGSSAEISSWPQVVPSAAPPGDVDAHLLEHVDNCQAPPPPGRSPTTVNPVLRAPTLPKNPEAQRPNSPGPPSPSWPTSPGRKSPAVGGARPPQPAEMVLLPPPTQAARTSSLASLSTANGSTCDAAATASSIGATAWSSVSARSPPAASSSCPPSAAVAPTAPIGAVGSGDEENLASDSAGGLVGQLAIDASSGSADESHDLFLRLSNLATKVVQLAKAMEKLELRDQKQAAAAAGRIPAPLGRGTEVATSCC